MAVKVSFVKPAGIGSIDAPAIGSVRVCETITVPGSTTAALQEGEIFILCSTEAAVCVAAHGTTPDAAAVAKTAATSAGYALPIGENVPVVGAVGDKINIKAFV